MDINSIYSEAKDLSSEELRDDIVHHLYKRSRELCSESVSYNKTKTDKKTEKLDQIFTSPIWGFPIMILMLGIIFYITIAGANVPSSMLSSFFSYLEGYITAFFHFVNAPDWLHGVLVLGVYRGSTWVISVMLPPMAIFFPTFALLENYGYLPRVAFILGLPANEIVLPVLLMGYLSTGALTEVDNLVDLKQIFIDQGWTWVTALNVMLFSLLHYPCGTTLLNIYKETKSKKWPFFAFLIPTALAIIVLYFKRLS